MAEFVRVDAHSLATLETFFSGATGQPVRFGPVWLAAGRLGAAIAGLACASAVTFGPLVCLSRASARRLADPCPGAALDALGALLVHECAHVWQYARDGTFVFLLNYSFSYLYTISQLHSISESSRLEAYLSIPAEVEATRLEQLWLAGRHGRSR